MTPQLLLESLWSVFPAFKAEWEKDNPYINEDGSFSFHSVFMEFRPHFVVMASSASVNQLKATASILNLALESGGELENAVSTCFFESSKRSEFIKIIRPYLKQEQGQRA